MSHHVKSLVTFGLIFLMIFSCLSEATALVVLADDQVEEAASTESAGMYYDASTESIEDPSNDIEAADAYFEDDLAEDGVEAEEDDEENSVDSEPTEELSLDAEPTEQIIEADDIVEQETAFEALPEEDLQTEEMADSLNATTFPEVSADERTPIRVNLPFNNGESVYPKWGLGKFDKDANAGGQADRDLAVCSLALCNAANNTKSNGDSTEIYKLLRKLGFEDIYLYYQTEDDVVDYPGMTFALYPKTIDGKYLITAVFRGTTDSGDVKTDIGAVGNGFLTAGTNCLNELKKYIAIMNNTKGIGITRENTILYISGHSYGGSCAGQVARMAREDIAEQSNIVAYTFGAPNYDLGEYANDPGEFCNIYNYVNKKDSVPHMPTKGSKLGYIIEYDIDNPSSTGEGLRFKSIYEHFVGVSYDKHEVSLVSIGDITVISNEHMPYTYMAWILADTNTFSDGGQYNKDSYLGLSSGGGSNASIDYVEIKGVSPESINTFSTNADIHLTIRCVLNNRSSDDLTISYNNSKDRLVQLYYTPIEKVYSSEETEFDAEVSVPAAELVNLSRAGKDLVLYANLLDTASYNTYTITLPKDAVPDQGAWYEDYTYFIDQYGNMEITDYIGDETDIVIPNTAYYNDQYYPVGIGGFCNNDHVEKITVEKGVKLLENGNNYFYNCTALKEVDFSGLDTSEVENMSTMFIYCRSLVSANLSGWDTSSVKDISDFFWECSSLQNVDLSGWDTSHVEDMSGMFVNCSALKNVSVSGFNTSSVKNMEEMFLGCSELESVDLSMWSTSNVSSIHSMFERCSKLRTANLSGWNTSNINLMYGLFNGCGSLNTINMSGWDMRTAINAGFVSGMFEGCVSLSVLHTPKAVSTKDPINLPKGMSEKNSNGSFKNARYTDLTKAPANTILYLCDTAGTAANSSQGTTVKVETKNQKIKKVTPSSKTLTVGQSVTLSLSGSNLKGKPVYSTSNKKAATVSSTGKVTAKSAGKATISVYVNKTGNYAKSNTVSCKITVIKSVAVKSVKLNKKNATIKKGKTVKLTATVSPKNATNKKVTWKSSNKKVATVSSKGIVKGIKKGKATITATTSSGKKKASCKVTVK